MIVLKSFELLFFKCVFQPNELAALQKYLPFEDFCIINIPGENICYGVLKEELHSRFMDLLSGETLELLEYLDEKDCKNLVQYESSDVIGNEDLLKRFFH